MPHRKEVRRHLWHKLKEGSSVWSRQPACQVLFSKGDVSGTGTVTACYLLFSATWGKCLRLKKILYLHYSSRTNCKRAADIKKKKRLSKYNLHPTHGMKCRVTADKQLHELLKITDNFLTVNCPKVCEDRSYSSTDRLEYVCAGQDPLGLRLGVTQRAESSPNGVYPWSASHFPCPGQSCEWHQSSHFNETNSLLLFTVC